MLIRYFFIMISILILSNPGIAQENILERYIREGIANNLEIQAQEYSVNRSKAGVDEATGKYLPSIALNSRYSRAGGGRTIDLPIGDIVNPIYSGLNTISGQNLYPTNIPNQTINFLRKEEQETKLRLVQPIFKSEIYFNHQLQGKILEVEEITRDLKSRELIYAIKKAYYDYLKVSEVVKLVEEFEKLAEENLRVSEKLVLSQKATKEILLRAEAEISEIRQHQTDYKNKQSQAAAYFNYLLNKDQDSKIITGDEFPDKHSRYELDENIYALARANREEIRVLDANIDLSKTATKINSSAYYPGLFFALDYGFEGEKFEFSDKSDFWMASLVLEWNIFNGMQDKAKIDQSEWRDKEIDNARLQLLKSINLQVREAVQNYLSALEKMDATAKRKESTDEYFRIISKKYENGMSPFIEYLDAKTALFQARVNFINTGYDLLTADAYVERMTAAYPLEKLLTK